MIPLIRFPRGAQASSKKIFASWLQGCSSCFSGLMPPLERCKGWNANGEGFMTGRCAKNGAPYAYIWPRTIYFYLDVAKPGRLCSTLHIDKTLNSWKTEQSGMICSTKRSSSWWLFNRPFPLPWKIGDLQEIEESREGEGEPGKGVRKETTHGAGCNARWFQWSTFSGCIGASRYTGVAGGNVAGETARLS